MKGCTEGGIGSFDKDYKHYKLLMIKESQNDHDKRSSDYIHTMPAHFENSGQHDGYKI